ncbi:MAG: hypothetical protein KKC79_00330 [Gammaproteobacteria bacterium]|nr:hypothetical protein [Gammaproteobacteria bacterium]MBU1441298.1 hypothetical protein [Gammaproteobacteria bacterium]MBU2286169.1 hypothetical protein [Gammaproteobacteria bacterium]MBU2407075.1 hypothetical protein [Gammaproteobacteria bacterium]
MDRSSTEGKRARAIGRNVCISIAHRALSQTLCVLALLCAAVSASAALPVPTTLGFSPNPGGAAYGFVERATAMAYCDEIVAPDFVQAAYRSGWRDAWLISTSVLPDAGAATNQICEALIGQCLANDACTSSTIRVRLFEVREISHAAERTAATAKCECHAAIAEGAARADCPPALHESLKIGTRSFSASRSRRQLQARSAEHTDPRSTTPISAPTAATTVRSFC